MDDPSAEVLRWLWWLIGIYGIPRVLYLLFRRETRRWLRCTHREATSRKEEK